MPDLQDNDIIQLLWDTGHFRNPAFPDTQVVKEADLPTLNLTSEVVKHAVQSYQDFLSPTLEHLSMQIHKRSAIIDGEIGPATKQLFTVERCGCPDYPENAAEAVGRGSWPAGCYPEYPRNHAFKVQVNKNGMPSFLQPIFEKCWDMVVSAYDDIGIRFVRADNDNKANTLVTFQSLSGSTIGLAIVPGSAPACNYRIWARFEPSYRPNDLVNQWARLLAHEFGHNMRLQHSRGGIMNPSIIGGEFKPKAWRGDPSESILTTYFGGVPVGGGTTPPPPPPPPVPPPPPPPAPPGGKVKIEISGPCTIEVANLDAIKINGKKPTDFALI